MKYDGRLYTQAEVDAMNNTPKTVEDLRQILYGNSFAVETRPDDFVLRINQKGVDDVITTLNELIRNERIDELEIQPLFSDKVEQAEYENNRIAELRAEERLQK